MHNSPPASQSSSPAVLPEAQVLVRVDSVSKKFCTNLRRSLWYGIRDLAGELNPFQPSPSATGSSSAPNGATLETPAPAGLRSAEFWAVNGVSFEVRRGECVGLIGHNGAGKTTLLRLLNGLIKPDHGRIEMRGKVGAMIALGAGFNPILTGRENIYVAGSLRGMNKHEITAKIQEIIDFAEVAEFIDMPVQGYSSGMQVRLGFAVASTLTPDILLIDEVLAVGDMDFRMKCLARVYELLRADTAVVLVSHSMVDIQRICTRTIVMDHGRIDFAGDVSNGIARYEALGIANRNKKRETKASSRRASVSDVLLTCGDEAAAGTRVQARTGDTIRLRFRIHVERKIEDARVRVFLDSARAGLVSSLSSAAETDVTSLEPGVHEVQIDFPDFPLLVGAYSIGISVHGNGTEIFYSGSQEALIEVVGPEVKAMARGNAGLLALPSRWRLETA